MFPQDETNNIITLAHHSTSPTADNVDVAAVDVGKAADAVAQVDAMQDVTKSSLSIRYQKQYSSTKKGPLRLKDASMTQVFRKFLRTPNPNQSQTTG